MKENKNMKDVFVITNSDHHKKERKKKGGGKRGARKGKVRKARKYMCNVSSLMTPYCSTLWQIVGERLLERSTRL